VKTLGKLDEASRARVLDAAGTFFANESLRRPQNVQNADSLTSNRPSFGQEYSPTPKEFMLEKQPSTDVERIACLAYFLTHYRNTPHFKTLDLAKLNTEAAQPKFSNTAYSANNAACKLTTAR
jgi:hypothetical protein